MKHSFYFYLDHNARFKTILYESEYKLHFIFRVDRPTSAGIFVLNKDSSLNMSSSIPINRIYERDIEQLINHWIKT